MQISVIKLIHHICAKLYLNIDDDDIPYDYLTWQFPVYFLYVSKVNTIETSFPSVDRIFVVFLRFPCLCVIQFSFKLVIKYLRSSDLCTTLQVQILIPITLCRLVFINAHNFAHWQWSCFYTQLWYHNRHLVNDWL